MAMPMSSIALAVAGLLVGGAAKAAGVVSGTDITNLATLNYSVGGTPQAPIGSSAGGNSTGAGTPTTFKVDNKVNLSLIENGNAVTSVAPGSTNQVTAFTLTNLGNTAQGYTFVAANAAGASIGGAADSIDVTNVRVFVESGANSGYQPLEDTASAVLTLAPDATQVVYVIADIPAGATNAQQANVTLTATTTTTGTATAVIQTTGAETPSAVDIVFADAVTTELDFVGTSPARDGKATARDAYRISSAVLTVAKTATLICDPFNGPTTPRSVPGSFVRYTITVTNSGPSTAILTSITDPLDNVLPYKVSFDNDLIAGASAAACVAGSAPVAGGAAGSGFNVVQSNRNINSFFTSTSSADGADFNTATRVIDVNFATVLPAAGGYLAGELRSSEIVSVIFQVQIN